MKRIVFIFCYEIDLIAQILEGVIHGCGRKEEDLGFYTFLYNIFHQALITALSYKIAFLIFFAGGVVTEIMGFINNYKVKISPVDCSKVDVPGLPLIPA